MNMHQFGMGGEQIAKIFPEAYYTKYANHLKILEFEKTILAEETSKTKLNFRPHGGKSQRRARTAVPKQQIKKVKMSCYDTFEETIKKNKQELKRIASLNHILEMKLKMSPRRNIIRSPAPQRNELQNSLYLKMKAIEDMEFQKCEQTKRKQRIEVEKRSVCKFVNKCKTARQPHRKRVDQQKVNPEYKIQTHRNIASKLKEIALESLEKNSSINLIATKATQRDAGYISTLNTAIKKSNSILKKAGVNQKQEHKILKLFRERGLSKTSLDFRNQKQKKDLVAETERIREQSRSMATLKRYDVILQKRAAKKDLQRQ